MLRIRAELDFLLNSLTFWADSSSSWAVLGRPWVVLALSWGHLGLVLGRLGAVLGTSWDVLGPSWAVLEPSWAVLWPSRSCLRRTWGKPWPSSSCPGPSWRCPGAVLARLGARPRGASSQDGSKMPRSLRIPAEFSPNPLLLRSSTPRFSLKGATTWVGPSTKDGGGGASPEASSIRRPRGYHGSRAFRIGSESVEIVEIS